MRKSISQQLSSAAAFRKAGQLDTAERILAGLLEQYGFDDPKSDKIMAGIGDFFRFTERVDEAIPAYRKALELNPDNVFALVNLGHILLKNGSAQGAEEAKGLFARALEVDRANPYARFHLSRMGETFHKVSSHKPIVPAQTRLDTLFDKIERERGRKIELA